MPTKVFLTGVTGYIGGDIFYALEKAHPDYEYTLLARNEAKGKTVTAKYPGVKLVYGTNDDSDVIEKAAAGADIVIHTSNSADDVPSAKAISKGIAAGHTAEKPGYYLHICGTGILCWKDVTENRFGYPPLKNDKGDYLESYDDIKDIDRILSLPDTAMHRDVDKIVLSANDSPSIKTAVVSPPCIYGPGRGPDNTRSMQVYGMTQFTLENGHVPVIKPEQQPKTGEALLTELEDLGKTEWDGVNVHDLSNLMVALVEAAQDPKKSADPEIFGARAYFFCEAGAFKWGDDVAQWIEEEVTKEGHVKFCKRQPTTVATALAKIGSAATWGLNSKSHASRARKYLGWQPVGKSLKESIPEVITSEIKLFESKRKNA